ncbi:aminoglycoside phosphotransferase family protein, partial [Candidatus Poribacteria bacterium]|nr:aminoglycoside phosphotransferase family protein [Candidatus Poribacteria bacterium]
EGIVFDRVDGATMHQHVSEHPNEAEAAGRAMAEIQARIHACEPPDLTDLRAVLAISIATANALDTPRKDAATDALFSLASGRALCHNDIHPLNLLLTSDGWVIIDWEAACRGNRLAGHARTWLVLSSFWPDSKADPESAVAKTWKSFQTAYIQTYRDLLPTPIAELRQWQTVVAAVGLAWDRTALPGPRLEVIDALLAGKSHPWLSDDRPE